jgi:hypothetical protein
MNANPFCPIPMSGIISRTAGTIPPWVWDGYLAAGGVTVLTSQWKTGKTTLLTGLLQALDGGGEFLGRPVRPGPALVVSEESAGQWAERLTAMPVTAAGLLARPFRDRPTFAEWAALIDDAAGRNLALFVIDPLASFLPGRCESDAATLLEALRPLHRLTAAGTAVLLLHHPRKKPSEPGSAARGSGALLGFADTVLELHPAGRLESDDRRRVLLGRSRRPGTPDRLAYEWDPATGRFAAVADPWRTQFDENWAEVQGILDGRRSPATHKELLDDWPAGRERPSGSQLYDWLSRAFALGRVHRTGGGTKGNPWRYAVRRPEEELPELPDLPPLEFFGRRR